MIVSYDCCPLKGLPSIYNFNTVSVSVVGINELIV